MKEYFNKLNNIKWKAFVIPLVPFLGYITAYCYEFAYAVYFNIPEYLIRIGIESIVRSTAALILIFTSVLIIVSQGYPLFISLHKSHKAFYIFLIPFLWLAYQHIDRLFSSFLLTYIFQLIVKYIILILIVIIVFRGLNYILTPLGNRFFKKNVATSKKMTEFAENVNEQNYRIAKFLFETPAGIWLSLIFITCLVFFLTVLIGYHDAEAQKYFLSFNRAGSKYLLIRKYEMYIATEVKNKKITKNILLLNDTSDIQFKSEYFDDLDKKLKL